MSIATRIQSINEHIEDAYNSLNKMGVTANDKNIENIAGLVDQIYENAPKTDYVSGVNLTIENTLKGKLKYENDMVGYGKSEQKNTLGINLFMEIPTQTLNKMTLTKTENGYILNGTTSAATTFRGTITNPVNSNKTLAVRCNTAVTNANIQIKTRDTNGGQLRSISLSTANTWETSDGEYEDTLCDIFIKSGITLNNVLIQPMLLNGTYSDTSSLQYEPYTGGIASPNPSYPQEVKVVKGSNEIKIINKNLINKEDFKPSGTYTDVVITNNNDGTLTLNGTTTANRSYVISPNPNYFNEEQLDTYSYKCFGLPNTCYTNIYYGSNIYGEEVYNLNVNTLNRNYAFVLVIPSGTTLSNVTIKPMLIRGSYTNSNFPLYVAHQEKNYSINLGSIELCKISTYQDYLYKENNKWYKYGAIEKIILDGTQGAWTKGGASGDTYSVFQANFELQKFIGASTNILCDNLIGGLNSSSPLTGEFIQTGSSPNSPIRISIQNSRLSATTSVGLNAYLETNNFTCYMPLATPTITEITDTTLITQLNSLYNAQSMNDITYITVDGDLPMQLKVKALKK